MLERADTITNEVLEPITFVLAYPIVYQYVSADSLQGTVQAGNLLTSFFQIVIFVDA